VHNSQEHSTIEFWMAQTSRTCALNMRVSSRVRIELLQNLNTYALELPGPVETLSTKTITGRTLIDTSCGIICFQSFSHYVAHLHVSTSSLQLYSHLQLWRRTI
jgi:hypothetical protein